MEAGGLMQRLLESGAQYRIEVSESQAVHCASRPRCIRAGGLMQRLLVSGIKYRRENSKSCKARYLCP